ncbi:hypothetical protein BESB_018480 [Besnoitia besnoiti]|uniref:Transmembrane protein n=1 Tax=Besnoitia besnoiti TaxID=94643 RepID=A0A2A9MAX7_BESBE|nr:hypothetical protein BESB_018480 [Besnoitia besnoiti]PFH32530.1 hypothetical protein BESB_018480 [Besnoitia besnoiti]
MRALGLLSAAGRGLTIATACGLLWSQLPGTVDTLFDLTLPHLNKTVVEAEGSSFLSQDDKGMSSGPHDSALRGNGVLFTDAAVHHHLRQDFSDGISQNGIAPDIAAPLEGLASPGEETGMSGGSKSVEVAPHADRELPLDEASSERRASALSPHEASRESGKQAEGRSDTLPSTESILLQTEGLPFLLSATMRGERQTPALAAFRLSQEAERWARLSAEAQTFIKKRFLTLPIRGISTFIGLGGYFGFAGLVTVAAFPFRALHYIFESAFKAFMRNRKGREMAQRTVRAAERSEAQEFFSREVQNGVEVDLKMKLLHRLTREIRLRSNEDFSVPWKNVPEAALIQRLRQLNTFYQEKIKGSKEFSDMFPPPSRWRTKLFRFVFRRRTHKKNEDILFLAFVNAVKDSTFKTSTNQLQEPDADAASSIIHLLLQSMDLVAKGVFSDAEAFLSANPEYVGEDAVAASATHIANHVIGMRYELVALMQQLVKSSQEIEDYVQDTQRRASDAFALATDAKSAYPTLWAFASQVLAASMNNLFQHPVKGVLLTPIEILQACRGVEQLDAAELHRGRRVPLDTNRGYWVYVYRQPNDDSAGLKHRCVNSPLTLVGEPNFFVRPQKTGEQQATIPTVFAMSDFRRVAGNFIVESILEPRVVVNRLIQVTPAHVFNAMASTAINRHTREMAMRMGYAVIGPLPLGWGTYSSWRKWIKEHLTIVPLCVATQLNIEETPADIATLRDLSMRDAQHVFERCGFTVPKPKLSDTLFGSSTVSFLTGLRRIKISRGPRAATKQIREFIWKQLALYLIADTTPEPKRSQYVSDATEFFVSDPMARYLNRSFAEAINELAIKAYVLPQARQRNEVLYRNLNAASKRAAKPLPVPAVGDLPLRTIAGGISAWKAEMEQAIKKTVDPVADRVVFDVPAENYIQACNALKNLSSTKQEDPVVVASTLRLFGFEGRPIAGDLECAAPERSDSGTGNRRYPAEDFTVIGMNSTSEPTKLDPSLLFYVAMDRALLKLDKAEYLPFLLGELASSRPTLFQAGSLLLRIDQNTIVSSVAEDIRAAARGYRPHAATKTYDRMKRLFMTYFDFRIEGFRHKNGRDCFRGRKEPFAETGTWTGDYSLHEVSRSSDGGVAPRSSLQLATDCDFLASMNIEHVARKSLTELATTGTSTVLFNDTLTDTELMELSKTDARFAATPLLESHGDDPVGLFRDMRLLQHYPKILSQARSFLERYNREEPAALEGLRQYLTRFLRTDSQENFFKGFETVSILQLLWDLNGVTPDDKGPPNTIRRRLPLTLLQGSLGRSQTFPFADWLSFPVAEEQPLPDGSVAHMALEEYYRERTADRTLTGTVSLATCFSRGSQAPIKCATLFCAAEPLYDAPVTGTMALLAGGGTPIVKLLKWFQYVYAHAAVQGAVSSAAEKEIEPPWDAPKQPADSDMLLAPADARTG